MGHGKEVDFWALGVVIYEMVSGDNPFFYDGMEQSAIYERTVQQNWAQRVIERYFDSLIVSVKRSSGPLTGKYRSLKRNSLLARRRNLIRALNLASQNRLPAKVRTAIVAENERFFNALR
jgi:serine/threonine protein kinase